MQKYLRGSEWRKWDLQVQTRVDKNYTCLSNNSLSQGDLNSLSAKTGLSLVEITAQEKTIDAAKYAKLFVGYLENFTDVSAVAITNHNTGAEIDEIMVEAEDNGKLAVFPGVEVSSNHGIHMLCIFDPAKKWRATWADSIDHFLTEIEVPAQRFDTNGNPVNAQKSSQQILDIACERGGLCIFAHIDTENGLFYRHSSTANGGNAHIDIYTHKLCNIVQLPHSGSVHSGVTNILNGGDVNYGSKSVTKISCSDARKITEIGSHFAWIKADPTFEGLKQIIYEPDERVRIQPTSPYEDRMKIFFDNFAIEGSVNFLIDNTDLKLNRELITVIGGRGSGKSALLDTIAFLNEAHLKTDQNNKKKIIEFYRDNGYHTDPPPTFLAKIGLTDKDGKTDSFQKNLSDKDNLGLPFLYLGQERLSGLATNDAELTKTVCQLIGIDAGELNQQDLVQKARDIIARMKNTEKVLSDLVEAYRILGYKDIEDLSKWIEDYKNKLAAQQQRLSSKDTRAALEDINSKTQKGLRLKGLLAQAEVAVEQLKNIEANTTIFELNQKVQEIYPDFKGLAMLSAAPQIGEIETLQGKIKVEMDALRQDIVGKKAELVRQGIKEDINTLLESSRALQQQINNLEKDLDAYQKAQREMMSLKDARDAILQETNTELLGLTQKINEAFSAFQSSRTDSSVEEKDLFEKIVSGIEVEGQIVLDEREFIKNLLENIIDNRKIHNEAELKVAIAGANQDGSAKDITFDSITKWITGDLLSYKYFNRGGENKAVEYIFTEWPRFLRVKTLARLNGRPTEVLSIGQRGTLLLKVYLATATAQQIFIIDQPEDNLDNNFIMHELVPLIKKAKKSRQIIMSTHNANLVVNADAEQVIVASLDQTPRTYISGSIEDPAINSSIRDILEGGEEAFRQRENKYQITR